MPNKRTDRSTAALIQERVKTFTRIEKAFYGSIVVTAVILAISVIFMQTKLLQIQQDLTSLNTKVEAKETQLNEAKQKVNELNRYERLAELASSQEMTLQNGNLKTADKE